MQCSYSKIVDFLFKDVWALGRFQHLLKLFVFTNENTLIFTEYFEIILPFVSIWISLIMIMIVINLTTSSSNEIQYNAVTSGDISYVGPFFILKIQIGLKKYILNTTDINNKVSSNRYFVRTALRIFA